MRVLRGITAFSKLISVPLSCRAALLLKVRSTEPGPSENCYWSMVRQVEKLGVTVHKSLLQCSGNFMAVDSNDKTFLVFSFYLTKHSPQLIGNLKK